MAITYQDRRLGPAEKIKDSYDKINQNSGEAKIDLKSLQGQIDSISTADSNASIGVYTITDVTNTNDYVGNITGLTLFDDLRLDLEVTNPNTGPVTIDIGDGNGPKDGKFINSQGNKVDIPEGELFGVNSFKFDGVDWIFIQKDLKNSYINVKEFGAVGDGVTDDTTSLQNAFNELLSTGGTLIFEKGKDYLISGSLGSTAGLGDKKCRVMFNGAKIKQAPTTTEYNMLYPSSNWVIDDPIIEGYIDSGTDYSDVIPTSGYGIKINGSQENVVINNPKITGCSFDGIYVGGTAKNIRINNNVTSGCFRNNVSVVGDNTVYIDGGQYGTAGLRTIDIEPNNPNSIEFVKISNLYTDYFIDVNGMSGGKVEKCVIDNVVFDGVNSNLQWQYIDNIDLYNLDFKNGAEILDSNFVGEVTSALGFGRFKADNIKGLPLGGDNLVKNSYNSLSDWSPSGSSTSIELNVSVPGIKYKGVKITSNTGVARDYTKIISVEPNKTYTFGGFLQTLSGNEANCSLELLIADVAVEVLGQCSLYTNGERAGNEINTVFTTPADADTVYIKVGHKSTASDKVTTFTGIYLYEGIKSEFEPSTFDDDYPRYSAPPTSGVWEVGDIVYSNTPTASGNIGWVCVTAGTPGTWKTFGTIQA